MPYYRNRRDDNESELVAYAQAIGAKLIQTKGKIPFDWVVLHQSKIYLAEIKAPDGKLRPSQQDAIDIGWPIHIWKTRDDVSRTLGVRINE